MSGSAAWQHGVAFPTLVPEADDFVELSRPEQTSQVNDCVLRLHGFASAVKLGDLGIVLDRSQGDAKLTEIGEGTSEIQRMIISRDLLDSAAKNMV